MAETTFTVTYGGPALDTARMDVRDLAPALIAVADVVQAAQRLQRPQDPPVSVEVTATSEGSFEIHLVVSNGPLLKQLVDLFSGDEATAAANLIQIVGGVTGFFAFVAMLVRRRIRRQEPLPNGNIRITLTDGTVIEIPPEVLQMSQDANARRAAREVVRPLEREGIDELRIEHQTQRAIVRSADVPAFDVPDETHQVLSENTQDVIVTIASPSFVEGNKWRLSLGDQPLWASIEDEDFVARVEAGEAFSKHDLLRVRLRLRQVQAAGQGVTNEYAVEEVLEHVMRERQVPLPFEDETPTGDGDGDDDDPPPDAPPPAVPQAPRPITRGGTHEGGTDEDDPPLELGPGESS